MGRWALPISLAAFASLAVFLVGLAVPPVVGPTVAADRKAPEYVSAKTCKGCHQKAFSAWQGSHHDWALKHANAKSVLGDFNDVMFEHKGVKSRFFKRDAKYYIETAAAGGKRAEYEIRYTVGVMPLQQYLVELTEGRLQALDIAWDTQQKRWFHLYPDQTLKPDDGLHWTGPYKNWNARCAVCHQTNFKKGYKPRTRRYQSRWSEVNVACESCHGPGQAHVLWAKEPLTFQSQKWRGVDDKGLSTTFAKGDAEKEIQVCATCHARRGAHDANSPPPGSKFADHYRLALLTNGLYHADGQIDGEVYVYGSFLQSKMYARGVRCSNCHEPHSANLKADGNAVCAQCHSPAGNTKFPTLKKVRYDDPSHHHHKAGSPGAQCVSCHMPAKTYMRVDPRRDHSFRVPRPDLSAKLLTPNACSSCHQDKTAKWAASKVKTWFPNGRMGTPHYAETLHAGRNSATAGTTKKLIDLALDKNQAAIVRATALDLLRRSLPPTLLARVTPLLTDPADLVRAAALRLTDRAPVALRVKLAGPLLNDPVKTVRIEAGRLFLTIPRGGLTEADKIAARNAIGEYQLSLLKQADFPVTQMQIAGLAMYLRRFPTAEKALRTAVTMDPQLATAWLTLARIQMATRKPEQARQTLEQAAARIPDNGQIHLQLGSLYTGLRKHDLAIAALEKGLQLSRPTPIVIEQLALNHLLLGNLEKARNYAKQLMSHYPGHRPGPLVRQLLTLKRLR